MQEKAVTSIHTSKKKKQAENLFKKGSSSRRWNNIFTGMEERLSTLPLTETEKKD